MKRFFLILTILVMSSTSLGGQGGERRITSDGGLRFTGGSGVSSLDLFADGDATVKLIRILKKGRPGHFIYLDAEGDSLFAYTYFKANGDSLTYLRSGFVRRPPVAGASVDSAYFFLDTATEVIPSW